MKKIQKVKESVKQRWGVRRRVHTMFSVPARIQLHSRLFHICCLVQLGVFVCVWFCQLCPSKGFFSLSFSPPHTSFPRERTRERGEREAGASSLEQAWQNLNYRSSTAKRRGSRGGRGGCVSVWVCVPVSVWQGNRERGRIVSAVEAVILKALLKSRFGTVFHSYFLI